MFTAQDPFYRQTGEECVDAGIGVNLFLFPSQYIDVASIGTLSCSHLSVVLRCDCSDVEQVFYLA